MKTLIMLALAAFTAFAMPAAAQQRSSPTVSVSSPLGISAVSDVTEIAMPSLPDGVAVFERTPAFFEGAQLCVSGLDANWAVRRDGTLDTRNPARRASCSPIINGKATVSNPFGPRAVPFIERAGRIVAWAGRDRLSGLDNS